MLRSRVRLEQSGRWNSARTSIPTYETDEFSLIDTSSDDVVGVAVGELSEASRQCVGWAVLAVRDLEGVERRTTVKCFRMARRE